MKSFDTPPQECPKCGYLLEVSTAVMIDEAPKVGDVTLCFGCYQVMEYGEGLLCHVIDPETLPEELQEILAKVIAALLAVSLPAK